MSVGKNERSAAMKMMEKVQYKLWKSLFKRLLARGIIDRSGRLFVPQFPHRPYSAHGQQYETLVAVNGFGYSGSSTIADILSEFDCTTVLANVNKHGSQRDRTDTCLETDFIRNAFGVFDLERAFMSRSQSQRDIAVKLFMHLICYTYKFGENFYTDEFIRLTRDFIDSIVKFKIDTPVSFVFAPYLDSIGEVAPDLSEAGRCHPVVSMLKDISVSEYRKLAKKYLVSFFKSIPSKKYLVLDQVLADGTCDLERYEDYVGKYKLIAVYRDPRDVYVQSRRCGYSWVAKNVDDFCWWYRFQLAPYIGRKDHRLLMLRFEDIVYRYDQSLAKIMDFLNLHSSQHINAGRGFLASASAKNIGLWRNCEYEHEVSIIKDLLAEYCYGDGV